MRADVDDINRALQTLYWLIEQSERLGLSRHARLHVMAIVGELEDVVARRASAAMGEAARRDSPADDLQ